MHCEENINETACNAALVAILRDFDRKFTWDVVRNDLAGISLILASVMKDTTCSQDNRELCYSFMLLLNGLQELSDRVKHSLYTE